MSTSACSQTSVRALRHHLRTHRAALRSAPGPTLPHAALLPRAWQRSAATFHPERAAAAKGGLASAKAATSAPSLATTGTAATPSEAPLSTRLAAQLRSTAPVLTETYVAYGATELLAGECGRAADYVMRAVPAGQTPPRNAAGEEVGAAAAADNWWFGRLGLEPTFNAWAQVGMLHLWLVAARLRAFAAPGAAPLWQQHLTDHFFYAAEHRMEHLHRMASRGVRQRYLKELFLQWRGVTAAYDEGFARGDAVLAAAVWRNVCKARPDVDVVALAAVVAYVRSALKALGELDDHVIAAADVVFGDPAGEEALVRRTAKGLREPFAEPAASKEV